MISSSPLHQTSAGLWTPCMASLNETQQKAIHDLLKTAWAWSPAHLSSRLSHLSSSPFPKRQNKIQEEKVEPPLEVLHPTLLPFLPVAYTNAGFNSTCSSSPHSHIAPPLLFKPTGFEQVENGGGWTRKREWDSRGKVFVGSPAHRQHLSPALSPPPPWCRPPHTNSIVGDKGGERGTSANSRTFEWTKRLLKCGVAHRASPPASCEWWFFFFCVMIFLFLCLRSHLPSIV